MPVVRGQVPGSNPIIVWMRRVVLSRPQAQTYHRCELFSLVSQQFAVRYTGCASQLIHFICDGSRWTELFPSLSKPPGVQSLEVGPENERIRPIVTLVCSRARASSKMIQGIFYARFFPQEGQ